MLYMFEIKRAFIVYCETVGSSAFSYKYLLTIGLVVNCHYSQSVESKR